MATLVAIGYPDERTAAAAAEEVGRLSRDLIIGGRAEPVRWDGAEVVTVRKDEAELQEALHGTPVMTGGPR